MFVKTDQVDPENLFAGLEAVSDREFGNDVAR